jgi:hypothetical protein
MQTAYPIQARKLFKSPGRLFPVPVFFLSHRIFAGSFLPLSCFNRSFVCLSSSHYTPHTLTSSKITKICTSENSSFTRVVGRGDEFSMLFHAEGRDLLMRQCQYVENKDFVL